MYVSLEDCFNVFFDPSLPLFLSALAVMKAFALRSLSCFTAFTIISSFLKFAVQLMFSFFCNTTPQIDQNTVHLFYPWSLFHKHTIQMKWGIVGWFFCAISTKFFYPWSMFHKHVIEMNRGIVGGFFSVISTKYL